MISRQQAVVLKEQALSYRAPILSLYLEVNPARPENHPKALAVRARETMKALGVPHGISQQVVAEVERVHHARSIAVFADHDRCDVIPLEVELPVVDPASGLVEARWGEPYVAPLLAVLDESERFGAIYVDRDRMRVFEIFLGQIEELTHALRPLSPREWDEFEKAKQIHPGYRAERNTAEMDLAQRRVLTWTARFYKQHAHDVEALVRERGIDRLLLLGPQEDVHFFELSLSRALRDRIAGRLPSMRHSEAPASEVLERVWDYVGDLEQRREHHLLAEVGDHGVGGLSATLAALQQGQLAEVLVPWRPHATVHIDDDTGYAGASADEVEGITPDGEIRPQPLRYALPDLAAVFGTRIEYLRGDARRRLEREHGGIAGIRRWGPGVRTRSGSAAM